MGGMRVEADMMGDQIKPGKVLSGVERGESVEYKLGPAIAE